MEAQNPSSAGAPEAARSKVTARKPRLRWLLVLSLLCAAGLLLGLYLARTPSPIPTAKPVAWRLQPDQFPIGTVLQGSRVELTLGVFSGIKPAPLPGFVSGLPLPLRKASEWGVETYRTWISKTAWRLDVEAPGFLKVDEASMQAHASQGAFAFVSLRLNTEQPGRLHGNLSLKLTSTYYLPTNIVIPVDAIVLGTRPATVRRVLITETPYECYATGNGHDFEPLADLNSALARQGVVLDYRRQLPTSLSQYSTILLGGSVLAELAPADLPRLSQFIARGGRLILAGDAFFVPTTPKANLLLTSYGMQILNQDAGMAITNSVVLQDELTRGVRHVEFWRPARIQVTDASQSKYLVASENGEGGYVAVSRHTSRGDVVVVTQSLWWNWIRSDPAAVDNRRLLENLLAR